MKVIGCEFNSDTKCIDVYEYEKEKKGDKVNLFIFSLRREKSKSTGLEQLVIDVTNVMDNTEICSNVIIKPHEISEGLLELKKYGFIIPRSGYKEISNEIEENYLNIKIDLKDSMSSELTKEKVKEIFEMFCEYIKSFDIKDSTNKKKERAINIPVNDFSKYLKDSAFSDFDTTKIRNGLRDEGYTFCNASRNDNTVIVGEGEEKKAIKVISFKFDEVYPSENDESKQ